MRVRDALRKVPSPLLGLSLGITGLGVAFEHALPFGVWLPASCAVSVPLLLIVAAKLALHPDILRQELRHPALGSLPVAASMVLMLFSGVIRMNVPRLGVAIWCIGVLISSVAFLAFCFFQIKNRKKENMLPSYFLSLGGMFVATMTVPRPEWKEATDMLMIFGGIVFFCILPFVVWRILFLSPLPAQMKPVVCIFAAPANMLIAAWLTTYSSIPGWGWPFIVIAVALNIYVYCILPGLMRLPFSPAQASLTFPMAITATAMFKLSAHYPALKIIAVCELVIASFVVACVCVRYTAYFKSALAAPSV